MPKQFFLPPEAVEQKRFHLKGPEAFHIVKVLRLRAGQSVRLFDGKGAHFEGVIDAIGSDGSVAGTLTTLPGRSGARRAAVHLCAGLLKASRWDALLEKATELGAASVTPVLTPRTVVLLHGEEHSKAKAERWRRVILAAAKQCGRDDLPDLRGPEEFRDAARARQGKGLALLAWEGMSGAPAREGLVPALSEALKVAKGEPLPVHLFVGPEGGFSEDEVDLAESLGVTVFGLGSRTLRAETAALAALSLIQYELGSL